MNPELPAFDQDALLIAETIKLVVLVPRETTCIPGSRELIEDLRAFHERWSGRVATPKACAIVEQFHKQCLGLEHEIEFLYLCALRDLATARREWTLAETFVQAEVAMSEMIKHCPEQLLPGLKAAIRGDAKEDPDFAAMFRESMADADASEVAYNRKRREHEEHWGDRLGDPLFQSIDRGDVDTATPLIEAAVEKFTGSSSG